ITKKFDLPSFDFPVFIDQSNVITIKAYLKDTHKTLLSYAKIKLQKLKESSIKQYIDQRCDNLSPILPK
ncbi:16345_t:CDS:1, partial [Funneliformis geosporum]